MSGTGTRRGQSGHRAAAVAVRRRLYQCQHPKRRRTRRALDTHRTSAAEQIAPRLSEATRVNLPDFLTDLPRGKSFQCDRSRLYCHLMRGIEHRICQIMKDPLLGVMGMTATCPASGRSSVGRSRRIARSYRPWSSREILLSERNLSCRGHPANYRCPQARVEFRCVRPGRATLRRRCLRALRNRLHVVGDIGVVSQNSVNLELLSRPGVLRLNRSPHIYILSGLMNLSSRQMKSHIL